MHCTRSVRRFYIVLLLALSTSPAGADEVLYNGIVLPKAWPPKKALAHDPVLPPYLRTAPPVIPIDVGRQLFVDDFLVERTTLERTFHRATYYKHNPVVKPDQPWEIRNGKNPCAMVFSDGVWFDPQDKLFKMWYMAGYIYGTGYATSKDGIHWDKPTLDVIPKTNLVQRGWRDSSTVWLDHHADSKERFKMSYYVSGKMLLSTSPEGIHWSKPKPSGRTGDRSTFFYNPFRKRWIFSIRTGARDFGRARRYWEAEDFLAGANWESGQPPLWTSADNADPKRDDLKIQPQLYNLDCVAYESLMLGMFTIWRGQPGDRIKPNELCVGFSRDGFHWHRPDRRAFIPVSEKQGDWNWGNVQSAGGCVLVVGDKLYFYVSGRAGTPGTRDSGVSSTGLAMLRRDGFASMDATDQEGSLTTRPIRFKGRHLFVNADVADGQLEAELLDADGKVVSPFTRENCVPMKADSTLAQIRWKGADDLSALTNKVVRIRFHVRRGSLYAFWVSPDKSGASHGYVGAGGPRFEGPTDTVGQQ